MSTGATNPAAGNQRKAELKHRIRGRARELGFDACHFTSAQPPESGARFKQWLASGQHGEMGYLERTAAKRLDPQLTLPSAKSIVTLAASYATQDRFGGAPGGAEPSTGAGHSVTANDLPSACIARYARSRDYHEVLGERLRALATWIEQAGGAGARARPYVDTGPVLERDLAQRSGLGFVGKHTNLISRRFGNWIFLAEILTTVELEPDPPERNRCGSCTRCITACPTQAIVAPFELDARRCLSYLTIELKGPIPLEFRRAIGNRIFGCDDCLEACPWNRFAHEGRLMSEHQRPGLGQMELLALLALDQAQFQAQFGGTPVQRIKLRGLRRNVCVALGNVGNAAALPALALAAKDSDPLAAEHARWAIAQIQAEA